jgi:hypothetical protein
MKDFSIWQKALTGKNGIAGSKAKSYSLLNYLFMEGVGKASPAEYAIFDHIPEEVMNDIAEWIKLNKKQ